MRRLLPIALICSLVGCGGSTTAPTSNGTGNSAAQASEAGASEKSQSATAAKPDYSVTATSYTDIPTAIDVLSTAAREEDITEIVRSERWLVMQGSAAIEPLGKIFGDEQADLAARIASSRVLRQLGPDAMDALRLGMNSSSQQIQLNAIKGLAYLKPTNDRIIRGMVILVDHDEQRIRQEAILGLAAIGPAAQSAAEERLIQLLNDTNENETLRDAAKRALKKVAPRRSFTD